MATMTNGSAINFGTVARNQNVTITNAAVFLDHATRDDLLVWTGTLSAQRTLVTDDPISIPVGDLDFDFPSGAMEDNAIVQLLTDGVAVYTNHFKIKLGTGNMGAGDGTNNEVTSAIGYTQATGVELTISAG